MKTSGRWWSVVFGGVGLAVAGLSWGIQTAEVQLVEERPEWGNFFSLQKTGDPPLPFNPFPELPLYWLGDNLFAFDDREVDYVALRQQWEAWWLLRQAARESLAAEGTTMETMEDEGPPAPPGYGGGGGTNEPPGFYPPIFLSSTGLCLYPPVITSSNTLTVTLPNGLAGAPYDLFMTTNLAPGTTYLNLTNWVLLYRSAPGQTNFTVTNYPVSEAYFTLGTTNDRDSDGLTDAYELLVSHTSITTASYPDTDDDEMSDAWELAHGLNPCSATDAAQDPDDDGVNNLQEYQHGTDPFDPMLVAWSKDDTDQATVPWGLGGGAGMAGGGAGASGGHTLMLTVSNSVIAWGDDAYGQTNIPAGIATNAVGVAAGGDQSAALLANGAVTAWGRSFASVPGGLANATTISAGYQHLLALRADGTIVAWGHSNCPANVVPTDLNSVRAISAGWNHNLALRSNGTVVVWGLNAGTLGWNLTNAPSGLTNIAAISAGALHSVVLRSNGSVVAWGYNQGGETNVPPDLSAVSAIAAGRGYTLALRPGGSVTGWGAGLPSIPPGLAGVTKIAAGPGHAMAVRGGVLTPLILRQPQSRGAAAGGSVTFKVTVASRREPAFQWQSNREDIAGATNASLTLTNVQSSTQGDYRVRVSNGAGTVWSEEAEFVLVLPPVLWSPLMPQTIWMPPRSGSNLTVVATAQGSEYSPLHYRWYRNGESIPWMIGGPVLSLGGFEPVQDYDQYWADVANVAGSTNSAVWTVRVAAAGAAAAWGRNDASQATQLPGLTNVIGLAGGGRHSLALSDDGTVTAWGANEFGQTNTPPSLTDVIAVAAGTAHSLALRADGSVVAWGRNDLGQTNVPVSVNDAIAIPAGGQQCLALKANGTVVPWGLTNGTVPAGLNGVTAIASGTNFHLALRSNTTVVAWGNNETGQTNVPAGLSSVIALAAGGRHALALREDGAVVAWGNNSAGQTNVPAELKAMAIAAGHAHSAALKNDGTIVMWGDNTYGQASPGTGLGELKLIAAGGDHTLAGIFSPLVRYPLEVSRDLLLIYNTASSHSSFVMNYYLAQRPMVSGANVLGINCSTNDRIGTNEFFTTLVPPVLDWLNSHPTKHPDYLILFMDVPAILMNDSDTNTCPGSVSWHLREQYTGTKPFVTHINLRTTNDCCAYIDKLRFVGTNSSPGKLLLSASAGGYSNLNYYLEGQLSGDVGYRAAVELTNSGVHPAQVFYNSNSLTLISPCTNVAGYYTPGTHKIPLYGRPYWPTNGDVVFAGESGWYIIQTGESWNGGRSSPLYDQSTFLDWFSPLGFGGTNYSHTPVGAVTHAWEPGQPVNDAGYFSLWAGGYSFGICAWVSNTRWPGVVMLQVVGDPFVQQ